MPTEQTFWSARRTITPLPGREPELAWRALTIAELATWLLASSGSLMLSATLDWDETDPVPRLCHWPNPDHDLDLRPFAFPPIATALERASAVLLEALRDRWPPYARPRRLGIVTDGTGVAFSPDDPWPQAPGWMCRQSRGAACLTQIVPFGSNGSWAAMIDGSVRPPRL